MFSFYMEMSEKGLTYKGLTISQIVGAFYLTAGSFNGFKHVPRKSFFERLIGPNAWYKAEFKKDGIESIIWENKNIFAEYDYNNSIEIKHNSERVYFARVHRYNPFDHINQKICKDDEWIEKVTLLWYKHKV